VIGSTTACVVSLSPSSSSLLGLCLGDSSFWLLRREGEGEGEGGREGGRDGPWRVVFRTQMQTHDFNMPFQLGTNCTYVGREGGKGL
jgi:hypothetical protein